MNKPVEHCLDTVMTVSELAEALDLNYNSLLGAVKSGRVQARQSGSIWLSTIAAVQAAIEAGKLRPQS